MTEIVVLALKKKVYLESVILKSSNQAGVIMDSDLNVSVTLGDTYIFIGDICLDQSPIQAWFHVVQFLIVLENYTGTKY